jgi:peptidoglycan/LPS O-acetylase OafA/YrhL
MSSVIASAPQQLAESNCLAHQLRQDRIPGLDFMRATAVMSVLLDHSSGGLWSWLDGVEIFFVLSGFLITWILISENETTGHIAILKFYRRRAARLLPAFYLYLVLGLLILAWRNRSIPWGAIVSAATYVINYYQAFTGAPTHYLSHCWSLAVEEQFYLIWPAFLLVVFRRKISPSIALMGVVVSVWIWRWSALNIGASDEYLYRSLETRADQLAIGGVLATILSRRNIQAWFDRVRYPGLLASAIVGLLLMSKSYLRLALETKYGLAYVLEPMLIATLIPLVIGLASREGVVSSILNWYPVILFGQVSYGVYLYHPFVIHPVQSLIVRMGGNVFVAFAASVSVVFMVAIMSFRWFESPLRSRLRGANSQH